MEIITLSGGPAPFDGQQRYNSDVRNTTYLIPIQEECGLVIHEWKRVEGTSVFAHVEPDSA